MYIILSLDADDMDKWRLEAGFVAGNMLLQGASASAKAGQSAPGSMEGRIFSVQTYICNRK